MNFFNLIMMGIGIGIGMLIQRLFHILEDSSPPLQIVKSAKEKRSLKEIVATSPSSLITSSSSTKSAKKKKVHRSDRNLVKTGSTKNQSEPVRQSSQASFESVSSSTDVTMSNVLPQNNSATSTSGNTSEPSMGTTQNITVTKFEVVPPAVKNNDVPVTAAVNNDPLSLALVSKVEKIVSPRRAVIRPSQLICDCGVELMDEKEKYSDETTMPNSINPITFTNKTKILPMIYERYHPLNLTHPPDGPTQLSPFVTKKQEEKEEATLLTPFKPVLHSMYYAHRHALLIGDLIENYDHLED